MRSPIGRSYSTNSANVVRHRHGVLDSDMDGAAPLNNRPLKRGIRKGFVSTSIGGSNVIYTKLLQAQQWMDETKSNLQLELSRGLLTRETLLRVVALAVICFTLLRLLVRFFLYAATLDSLNELAILIPTQQEIQYNAQYNLQGTFPGDATKRNTLPWIDGLPFLRRSIRTRYGTIQYHSLSSEAFDMGRRIRPHDNLLVHNETLAQLEFMDLPNEYHDAREKDLGNYVHYDEQDYPARHGCYRPKWSYVYQPTCNSFHEVQLDRTPSRRNADWYVDYISHGFFRETFLMRRQDDVDVVLKVLRLHKKKNVNAFVMQQVQIEAVVMGESSGSGLTFRIYGHCGTSVSVERGYLIRDSIFTEELVDQNDLDREQIRGVVPRNKLTNEQKLRVALTMAKSLAVLHGNKKGVIANDDVQIEQWLLDRNGNLKLNDFNNAVIVKWSPEKKDYCMFRRSFNYIYRSPEENTYQWTSEASDIYALGMIYYTLMTGLVPFYQHEDWDKALAALKRGDKPYVDPRYANHTLIEWGLVKVMKPCWSLLPHERPSIFTLVKRLRQLVNMYEEKYPGTNISQVDLRNIGYM
ncbi:hypothetical protein MPSEU_000855500 [Mayamaea pseudoterrestris]|nr:hypothetical protein MPSEU_000855500 [Mayamaea pseudoterrestris]